MRIDFSDIKELLDEYFLENYTTEEKKILRWIKDWTLIINYDDPIQRKVFAKNNEHWIVIDNIEENPKEALDILKKMRSRREDICESIEQEMSDIQDRLDEAKEDEERLDDPIEFLENILFDK